MIVGLRKLNGFNKKEREKRDLGVRKLTVKHAIYGLCKSSPHYGFNVHVMEIELHHLVDILFGFKLWNVSQC